MAIQLQLVVVVVVVVVVIIIIIIIIIITIIIKHTEHSEGKKTAKIKTEKNALVNGKEKNRTQRI